MEKTAIIALGGNALSNKGQAGTVKDQFSNTRKSLTEIIKFLKYQVIPLRWHGKFE